MRFEERRADEPTATEAAAGHVRKGGLLAHPTSGVYGIGGAADPSVAREVARLKGRSEGPGFVHLVADPEAARRTFPSAHWPPLAERLAEAFWPGPLTLVLEDGSEHGIAVRVEPHAATRRVLQSLGRALSSTSLNRAGAAPASDAASARRALRALPPSDLQVLFLEAGRLSGPPPSTLVRVPGRDGRRFELLRAGAVDEAAVRAVAEEEE